MIHIRKTLREIPLAYVIYRRVKTIHNSIWGRVKFRYLVKTMPSLRIVVGASGYCDQGWIPTDIENLNIIKSDHWMKYFLPNSIDAILAEHVWEHLTYEEGISAAENCFHYLKHGGFLRIAVPDGNHPLKDYIDLVKVGGNGVGASDHKVLYDYKSLCEPLANAGFILKLLEYFDDNGNFHCEDWNPKHGMIFRSANFDKRNLDGNLTYTSLIIDAYKE